MSLGLADRHGKLLIDSRSKDGFSLVLALQGRKLAPAVLEAACLLLTVLGQDLEERDDGIFAIATGVSVSPSTGPTASTPQRPPSHSSS